MRKKFFSIFFSLLILLTQGCRDQSNVITIVASPNPHAELLYALTREADELGLKLRIIPIDDYRVPNRMLLDKQIDANYFQHQEFLQDEISRYKCSEDVSVLLGIHLEPMGLYSSKYSSLTDLQNRDQLIIAVPIDRTNEKRALDLLVTSQLVSYTKLRGIDVTAKDVKGFEGKNVKIVEIAAPLLVSSMPDVDAVVIPGNFAISAGLSPKNNSLMLEDVEGSCYTNVVVVRKEDIDKEKIIKLKKLLSSKLVREFFEANYGGDILVSKGENLYLR
ncbi:NLPA lipofamily protein [Chlamydia ibidis]|uniref:NLPA lipofamily protein n=2 Tax=Chlamydia ibidis TaxID=1405396 RepID=S7J4D7_9CHLA|nr:MetQ/NlpA family ABC transporter substrate-binding protein [Chlamydia ibidis]EPP35093.1 NLPA lipofamily protein [Chlamydia ibidis]EQM62797.1 NLPA lipofamily protein [Chlamydia ibidis 10-1398/6]